MSTWVHTNPRPFAAVLVSLLLVVALLLTIAWLADPAAWLWWTLIGVAGGLSIYALWLVRQIMVPRVAVVRGDLRMYLTPGRAVSVPLEYVECFLLSEGPAFLGRARAKTTTLSIRIAERATEYHNRTVLRVLGGWCGGYVTIRGTWTEPLTVELVRKLNANLTSAKSEWSKSQRNRAQRTVQASPGDAIRSGAN